MSWVFKVMRHIIGHAAGRKLRISSALVALRMKEVSIGDLWTSMYEVGCMATYPVDKIT
ncbi:hypothetical protein HMPREF0183_1731 [Brevibacterium mcbrellneri ATCC 49030]|uniref:Uncharacterized protein n=1 Tax=Brevibacterium mcbrellneri ATCC 49030 TaxID=585530 RepID=D4YP71_9MICO|nr:hypothetical protein HMPREF0183_1731 [Brevibacterium mcbrellneri ATCC 49030]